jgi:DNA polymerase
VRSGLGRLLEPGDGVCHVSLSLRLTAHLDQANRKTIATLGHGLSFAGGLWTCLRERHPYYNGVTAIDFKTKEGTSMSNSPLLDQATLARQVRQQLESLKAAGVEYLPTAPPRSAVEPVPALEPAGRDGAAGPTVASGTSAAPSPAPASADGLTPEQRRQALQVLTEKVACCTRCPELVANRSRTVFGVGPIDVELCFVGEAPGFDEDRRGEPFVGKAGQLLDRIIAACGFKREEVYICNIVKCRPPDNRQPTPVEAGNCREYLERQLELVRPRFLCALGSVAVQNLLGTSVGITRLRGSFQEYRGIPVMCTFHPSYLLRKPEAKKEVWDDMKKLLTRMGRPIPKH